MKRSDGIVSSFPDGETSVALHRMAAHTEPPGMGGAAPMPEPASTDPEDLDDWFNELFGDEEAEDDDRMAVSGGATVLDIAAIAPALSAFGITTSPYEAATAEPAPGGAVFSFPITGGGAEGDELTIEHDGSGVTLWRGDRSATIGNFEIEISGDEARIVGDVIGRAEEVDLFQLGESSDNGIEVFAAAALAAAIGGLAGEEAEARVAGATFGYADTAPTFDATVPPPEGAQAVPTEDGTPVGADAPAEFAFSGEAAEPDPTAPITPAIGPTADAEDSDATTTLDGDPGPRDPSSDDEPPVGDLPLT